MAASLASILEVPLESIPDFGEGDEFMEDVADFLAEHGLYYVQISPDDTTFASMCESGDIFHTIEGVSPRGGQHAVVGLCGDMVWDPHPEDGTGHGLVSVECFGLLCDRMIFER